MGPSSRITDLQQQLSSKLNSPAPSLTSLSPLTKLDASKAEARGSELLLSYPSKINEFSRQQLLQDFPSPMQNGVTLAAALGDTTEERRLGHLHTVVELCSVEYGGKQGSNVVLPLLFERPRGETFVDLLLCLCNPEDAIRIANSHVKKSLLYSAPFLGEGVLSTFDNQLWSEQRKHLSEAFLPKTNLLKVFHRSRSRAEYAVNHILPSLSVKCGQDGVEINEFLMFEAMAQLQYALLGETAEIMEKTNKPLRKCFKDTVFVDDEELNDANKIREKRRAAKHFIASTGSDILEHGRRNTVEERAPLMNRLLDLCPFGKEMPRIQRDAATTFLFAGHDTTANLMTHFVYEMARNPVWQTAVQKEVDSVFEQCEKEKRKIEYTDLKNFQVMKRCINETLRLWPSVPNGTFREFEFDDVVTGKNGEKVVVAKGTNCMIPVWSLHRNRSLWGDDVDEFNPNREWTKEEDWDGLGLSGQNPASHRFCPFTFGPRDCMGRNFAQMEARIILSHMLRNFTFSLAEQTKGRSLFDISKNFGTLGPANGLYVLCSQRT